MSFRVVLPLFSGPIELLLYLIRKNEVSIFEVPLSLVTAQFLEFVHNAIPSLPRSERSQSGYSYLSDFILMAAVLIRMKLRKLLPHAAPPADEKSNEPVVSLFEICEEFERYKKLASILSSLEEERLSLFARPGGVKVEEEGFDIVDLMKTFHQLLQKGKNEEDFLVERVSFRLEERIFDLRERIRRMAGGDCGQGKHFLTFFALLKDAKSLRDIIIIFFALLELAWLGEVKLLQERDFEDIIIIPRLKDWTQTNTEEQRGKDFPPTG